MSLEDQASLLLIPTGYKSQKVYSIFPTNGDGDFDFSRPSSATRIAKNGLITTVDSNVPRLEYPLIDGVVNGCPSLLLEPTRSNYLHPSNNFSSWTLGGTVTRTANYGISPDGSQNSTRADFANGGIIYRSPNRPQGSYVFSVFAKNIEGGGSEISLRIDVPTPRIAIFDLSNGTIVSNTSDDAKIEYYGNGWYRCILIENNEQVINTIIGEGTTELDCELFGAMLEEGSHITSYIPTNGESGGVTRLAETCNGAGNAATFNDSEGVLYANIEFLTLSNTYNDFFGLNNGSNSQRLLIERNTNVLKSFVGSAFLSTTLNSLNNKISISYKLNDFKMYLNGFEVDLVTSGTTPNGLDRFDFKIGGTLNLFTYSKAKEIGYYDTALTDEELEYLTSYRSLNELVTELNLNEL